MNSLLAIFFGGGLGSLLRFGIGKLVRLIYDGPFPLGTLFANLLSCGILALVLLLLSKYPLLSFPWKALLLIGFCGGLSTFSTFSLESFQLLRDGQWGWMLLNVGVSVGGCLLILYLILGDRAI